jgi:aconitate hydratase
MGVLPLQFEDGQGADELGLTGKEQFTITGIAEGLRPGKKLKVVARANDGKTTEFGAICRIDTPNEVEYYRHGGILQYVLRNMLKTAATKQSAS